MKKQIFILVLFVLAVFANVNKSYGQCLEDPLHPIAGKAYSYGITVGGSATAKSYFWFVTDDPNVLTAGNLVTPLTATGNYVLTNGNTATATITWTPALIATAASKNYYVVVKYVATNTSATCDVENIKAYKIRPTNMFQLDLANANSTGGVEANNYSTCTSAMVTAHIVEDSDPTKAPTITYDYGTNEMLFKITVRNFSGAWNLSVNRSEIAALAGTAETFTMGYCTTYNGTYTSIGSDNPVSIAEGTTLTTDDEIIYLKVTFDHNTFEDIANKTVVLKANATDAGNNPDLSSTCTAEADQITQILLGRPSITTNTIATPNDFILP